MKYDLSNLTTAITLFIVAQSASAQAPTADELTSQIRNDEDIEKVVWVPSQMWRTQQEARILLSNLGIRHQIIELNACDGRKTMITEQAPAPEIHTLPDGTQQKGSWISTQFGSITLKSNSLPPYQPLPAPADITLSIIKETFTAYGAPGVTTDIRLQTIERSQGTFSCSTTYYSKHPKVQYLLPEDQNQWQDVMSRDVCPGEVMRVSIKTQYLTSTYIEGEECGG